MKRTSSLLFFISLFFFSATCPAIAAPQNPVVRAVLFFSLSCPACHVVMEDVLPPLVDQYTDQLDIVGIDVSNPAGQQLYQVMVSAFSVPGDRFGVPTLVVGSNVLVGQYEIKEQLPQLIDAGLAAQGIDWPDIPGLDRILASQPAAGSPYANVTQQTPEKQNHLGFINAFLQDPIANSIAIAVLIGLVVVSIIVLVSYLRGPESKFMLFPEWIIPLLAVIGLGIAIYMTLVEVTGAEAVCGPVGNCNSVQESSYSRLMGIIPIGMLGVVGYFGILAAWLGKTYHLFKAQRIFTIALWGLAWFGTLFSIYLTFLEPFVIGATCAWCLSSAIIMGLMLLATTSPAKEALRIEMDEEEFPLEGDKAMS